ncbi:uncharacterized protein LOC117342018 isoform X2 [Pecten maximus]|uniref:uncharacterized protein LOC117342018 isoform X2 n=1 Tax=Pecten maximus TaxID=6579 RepID=UPI0014585743|nr:uncharacterized protein LOC117342018 isoform X2 [Pecten maximus]
MDKPYSILRGVSYANSHRQLHHASSSDMATMIPTLEARLADQRLQQFSGAATGGSPIEMNERDRGPILSDDTPPPKEEEGMSCRRVCSFVVIIPMIFGVIALVVIGIIYLPEPTNPPPTQIPETMPFCLGSISPNSTSSAQSDCPRLAASVALDVSKVMIYSPGNLTVVNSSLSLSGITNTTVAGLWTINWSDTTGKLIVSPIQTALTCNMEGTYLFQYLSRSDDLKYYQQLSLTYLGNLADVQITAQPYLEGNGASKSIYLRCSMRTGCHHGVIVPELNKGTDTLFIEDASCSYKFNNSIGGEVTCTTIIDEDVWVSKDEVVCALKPEDGVHKQVQAGRIITSDVDLTNYCSAVSFTIGESGHINCRKITDGNIDIVLSRKGHYFGDWTKLVTISGEGSGKALDDRLTFSAVKSADIIDINITISEVHCGDKGQLALNYSDGSSTNIDIDVSPKSGVISQNCPASVTAQLHAANNLQLVCSWCPGHKVDEVIVNHTKTTEGVTSELQPFPISFYLDQLQVYKTQNLTIQFTQEYGVMRVVINRLKGVGCKYGDDYTVTLRSPEGSSTRNIRVNITVPESLYTYTFTNPPVIANQDLEIEFKGFIGCAVTSLTA